MFYFQHSLPPHLSLLSTSHLFSFSSFSASLPSAWRHICQTLLLVSLFPRQNLDWRSSRGNVAVATLRMLVSPHHSQNCSASFLFILFFLCVCVWSPPPHSRSIFTTAPLKVTNDVNYQRWWYLGWSCHKKSGVMFQTLLCHQFKKKNDITAPWLQQNPI